MLLRADREKKKQVKEAYLAETRPIKSKATPTAAGVAATIMFLHAHLHILGYWIW